MPEKTASSLLNTRMSRREFLKLMAGGLAGLAVTGCARALGLNPTPTSTSTPSPTLTTTPTIRPTHTATTVPTATPTATATPEPTRVLSLREQRLLTHEEERLRRLALHGPARTLTSLEYHGNSYTFNGGVIDMNPERFHQQMRWLQENDIHTVTFDELHGFLDGSLDLPLGSIILTTDSGMKSHKSMPEMLEVLAETGNHFLSFIWTISMDASESLTCKDDFCWKMFADAHATGLISLGTHTESHDDFALMSAKDGLADIRGSQQEIFDHLGVMVNSISWPFESIPEWAPQLAEIGILSGFGGTTRPLSECYAEKGDDLNLRYRLPRLLPPNTNGESSRPFKYTLERILQEYSLP